MAKALRIFDRRQHGRQHTRPRQPDFGTRSSDSGSDLQGGPGLSQQLDFGIDAGTTSDQEHGTAGGTAGPDVGDADLDSDSDSGGTGERASAARDTVAPDGADIDVDHIETIGGGVADDVETGELDSNADSANTGDSDPDTGPDPTDMPERL